MTGVAEDDLTVEVESRKRSRETLPGSGMKRSHTCSDLTDVKRIPALPLQRSGLSGNMDDLMSMWTHMMAEYEIKLRDLAMRLEKVALRLVSKNTP